MAYRRRPFSRKPLRRNVRSPARHLYRSCIRNPPGFRNGPDDLSQALAAFRQAIRAHRKLARLAPEFFDATEVDRLAHRRKQDAEWMALWEPALNKAYGLPPDQASCRNPRRDLPRVPASPRTRRAVERELASWRFWLAAGDESLQRYRQRFSRRLLSLSRIAQLLEIGMNFRRLACGSFVPDPEDSSHAQSFADLKRAYGRPLPGEENCEVTPS
jgi:hypothetical protein